MLGEILEGGAVEKMVAEAWEWLGKRLWAGFGLDLGWPQAVHASKIFKRSYNLNQSFVSEMVHHISEPLFIRDNKHIVDHHGESVHTSVE